MSVKLLTEHHLEFVSLKGGCTGSSESTLVEMQRWKSHVRAHIVKPVLSSHSKEDQKVFMTDYRLIMQAKRLSTCVKLPSVFKSFVLTIFEWPLKTGFTVIDIICTMCKSSIRKS